MSAYNREGLSVDAYMVRLVTAIVRQNGGEMRIKGEEIDRIGEPTALIKEWDSVKQEVVLRAGQGSFVEVFRVTPERQTGPQTAVSAQAAAPPPNGSSVDPLSRIFRDREPEPFEEPKEKSKVGSTLDNEKLAEMENTLRKKRVARLLADEMAARNRANPERTTTP